VIVDLQSKIKNHQSTMICQWPIQARFWLEWGGCLSSQPAPSQPRVPIFAVSKGGRQDGRQHPGIGSCLEKP